MSVSHVCDKYSANSSFKVIRSDLVDLRAHLNTLSVINLIRIVVLLGILYDEM